MRFTIGLSSFSAAILLNIADSVACPLCSSDIGEQVRDGIFNEHFGYNLLVTLSPFPILAGILAVIYFGGRHSPTPTGQPKERLLGQEKSYG